jgi:hypothetical protein
MNPNDAVTQKVPLQGVGGWLLVLCLYLMVLIPLLAVLELFGAFQNANLSPTLKNALLFGALFEIALAAFAFYAGLALYKRRPNAIAVTKVYFIAMLTLGVLGLGIVLMGWVTQTANSPFAGRMLGPALVAAVRPVILSALWLFYLEHSKRVRATYSVT